jgi:hypothetical protein
VKQGLSIDTEIQFDVSFRSIYRQRPTFFAYFWDHYSSKFRPRPIFMLHSGQIMKLGLAVLVRTEYGPARPNFSFHSGLDLLFGSTGLLGIQRVKGDPIFTFIPEWKTKLGLTRPNLIGRPYGTFTRRLYLKLIKKIETLYTNFLMSIFNHFFQLNKQMEKCMATVNANLLKHNLVSFFVVVDNEY